MKKIALILVVIMAGLSACKQEQAPVCDVKAEKEAIKMMLQKYIIANEAHNLSLISELWANDSAVLSLGTDEHDVFKGFNAVEQKFAQQFERFEDTFISSRDIEIYVHPQCQTAWFSEFLQYNYTNGDKAIEYSNLRFTGFLEKRAGNWVMLQTHLSAPADR
ncbi:MAG: nuclear transport factor 2 family protein [Lentimicrobiaceae bacterium]|nr:nuclear transport factor 2 family protein [Lentimicrobiaceae bacterium]MCB9024061.1 nuclear transport factor 2 family protein [Lentimicrobiaceae bacterium]MCO5266713.1 nuclear transport factor 2 family protein [Lentimicrobium sp.]HPG34362.1 nuclear transport factor 2 family protein [Lentimicrobium sp.]